MIGALSALLITSLVVAPPLASGQAVGKLGVGASLQLGFPFSEASATVGITERVDVGPYAGTSLLQTQRYGVLARADLLHRERFGLAMRSWGGLTDARDLFYGQVVTASGPGEMGALVTLSSRSPERGLSLYLNVGARVVFRPYAICYGCGGTAAATLVPGKGIGLRFPFAFGVEAPAFDRVAMHLELGIEVRPHFPDNATTVFPMPMLAGGLTWQL